MKVDSFSNQRGQNILKCNCKKQDQYNIRHCLCEQVFVFQQMQILFQVPARISASCQSKPVQNQTQYSFCFREVLEIREHRDFL